MTDAPPSVASTRGEIASGAAWMLAFKLSERLLGFVSTLVLVRVLVPDDFGVVAMAMSLVAILELLKSFSFDLALIQRKHVDREHLDTAWTYNLLFGLAVTVLMVLLAKPAAAYYGEPRLAAVVLALAAGWLIQSFENIGPVAFRRELDFRTEYRFLVAKKLAAVLVTVPLALWLRNYWALVAGTVVGRALSVWISFRMHPFRPRLSVAAGRDLMGVSGWLLVNNVLYFLNERLTDFVIGRMVDARALGLFNVSHEISNMPTTEIVAPVNRVMLPGFSKLARTSGELRQTYLDTVGVLALFSLPAGVGIAAVAEPLVRVLLGPRWLAAIPLMQLLGIYGAVLSLGTSTGAALLAVERQRALTGLAAARLALLVPAVLWATHAYGVIGTAWAVLVVTVVMAPVNYMSLMPLLGIRVGQFLRQLWRPAIGAVVMFAAARGVLDALAAAGLVNALLRLVVTAIAGAATYVVVVGLLWLASGRPEGSEAIVLRMARSRLAAGRRAREGGTKQ